MATGKQQAAIVAVLSADPVLATAVAFINKLRKKKKYANAEQAYLNAQVEYDFCKEDNRLKGKQVYPASNANKSFGVALCKSKYNRMREAEKELKKQALTGLKEEGAVSKSAKLASSRARGSGSKVRDLLESKRQSAGPNIDSLSVSAASLEFVPSTPEDFEEESGGNAKWAAVGVGALTLAGLGYYFYKRSR